MVEQLQVNDMAIYVIKGSLVIIISASKGYLIFC